MASVKIWKVLWCLCFISVRILKIQAFNGEALGPAPEFLRHVIIRPKIFHGRDKRSLLTTRKEQGSLEHEHDIVITYNIDGKDHLVDLRLNRELIPNNYFEKHQENGSHVVRKPRGKDFELCHYIGKVRDADNSWAALSTCNGLRGVVFDGNSLYYIEKSRINATNDENEIYDSSSMNGIDGSIDHYIYRHSDLDTNINRTCGYSGDVEPKHFTDFLQNSKLRHKRSTEKLDYEKLIRGPYNANKMSRYVELVLVVDNKDFIAHNESKTKVFTHCKDIANIINALYVPLNIFIALVGVVVWTEKDEIVVTGNGDHTLTNFLKYRRDYLYKTHPNDNAQLLTKVQFQNGVVGKALKGPICTYEYSGGVNMDHSLVVGLVATTIAHEMGHNFGMEHDNQSCECPEERCIMAHTSGAMSPTHWSSCSLEYLAHAFQHGMDYCLRNKPKRLFDSPVCGNGFVEGGEQCDCGLKEYCDNPCCNASTCMLHSNASCATGECCDLTTCRPRSAGILCRLSDHECDLPEYCTGQSEYCPTDVYKMDGIKCNKGKAFCYQGLCRTHSDQCKLLWGPSGKTSDEQCYKMNVKGSRYGNCGYNRIEKSFIKCGINDTQCGMLHCIHLNERLEFGMESVASMSHTFLNPGDSNIIPCRSVTVDLGLSEIDPGLAPDGAKCGPDMMCVNQKCINVTALHLNTQEGFCPNGCSGNGVCNSNGHCHCNPGYAPPSCENPGTGGSIDSGPATDPNARREVIMALYVVFLIIVPFVTIVALYLYYKRHDPAAFWLKKPRSVIIVEKKYSNSLHPKGGSGGNASNSNAMVNDHSRASLLPQTSGAPASSPDNNQINSLQIDLFGQFKGFSITPLPTKPFSSSVCLPIRPAPVSPPKVPSNVAVVAPVRPAPKVPPTSVGLAIKTDIPPALPPANVVPARPAISSPVLDTTTSCAAQELINNIPTRSASEIPNNRTPRPVSTSIVIGDSQNKVEKSNKDTSYPTLTRIASFMARSQKDGNKKESLTGSLRINKLDKAALRSLEISNPIPQREIEIPGVSVFPAGKDKPVVMRAQSMRDGGVKKPQIHSFGSMRAVGAKRPTSIPVSSRPTSPPPPRPPSIGVPGYQTPSKIMNMYDDCLNTLSDNMASLSNIDEESPNSATDNIYAVIEESPIDRRERKEIILPRKLDSCISTVNEYNLPKPSDNSSSTSSSESVGLLGEIVSEIQARNTDSIYSTSTLKRKKETDDETGSTFTNTESDFSDCKSNQIYVNTTWNGGYDKSNTKSCASSNSSNSGYLSPVNAAQNIQKLLNSTEDKSCANVPSVPESTAPSYKPYSSSLNRSNGPFATFYNKSLIDQNIDKNNSSRLTDVENSSIKPNSIDKNVQIKSLITNSNEDTSKSINNSTNSKHSNRPSSSHKNIPNSLSSVKSPHDINSQQKNVLTSSVTSVNPTKLLSESKPPGKQINNSNPSSSKASANSKKSSAGLKVTNNANNKTKTVAKIGSIKTGKNPVPAPKPVVLPSVKTSGQIVPVKNKSSLTTSKKGDVVSSNEVGNSIKPDAKSNITKPSLNKSNVASLQKKFESSGTSLNQKTNSNNKKPLP